jgi:hypothetical protein
MTIPTNAQTTYPTIGNREDLSDEVWKISPTETPFFSAVEKISTSAVNHEWQTVALDAVNTSNAVLEGDTFALLALTPTVRLGNIHQISSKAGGVSRTQRSVNPAGRADELGWQKMLKGQALKIDIDAILCGTNQAKNAGSTTLRARRPRSCPGSRPTPLPAAPARPILRRLMAPAPVPTARARSRPSPRTA